MMIINSRKSDEISFAIHEPVAAPSVLTLPAHEELHHDVDCNKVRYQQVKYQQVK